MHFPSDCVKNARNTKILLRFFPCQTKDILTNPEPIFKLIDYNSKLQFYAGAKDDENATLIVRTPPAKGTKIQLEQSQEKSLASQLENTR